MAIDPNRRYRRTEAVPIDAAKYLEPYAEKFAAERELQRRRFESDAALVHRAYAPVLRAATVEVQEAARDMALRQKALKEKSVTTPLVVPDMIVTHPGMQLAGPAYDDVWYDPRNNGGTAYIAPNKDKGTISIELTEGQYGAAGLLLSIIPSSALDLLFAIPQMQFTGAYGVQTYFIGAASVAAEGDIIAYAFDERGNPIEALNQQQSFHVYDANANGIGQENHGGINTSWQPVIELQRGASYAFWMILRNGAATNGNAQCQSDVILTVPNVVITEG